MSGRYGSFRVLRRGMSARMVRTLQEFDDALQRLRSKTAPYTRPPTWTHLAPLRRRGLVTPPGSTPAITRKGQLVLEIARIEEREVEAVRERERPNVQRSPAQARAQRLSS